MGILKAFFRQHRAMRWFLRLIITVILACIAGMLLMPTWRDYQAVRALGQGDAQQRNRAMQIAANRVLSRPEMLEKIIGTLDTPDEPRFLACCKILRHFKKFTPAYVSTKWLDRYALVQLHAACRKSQAPAPEKLEQLAADTRRHYIYEFIASGDSNEFTAQALDMVINDPQPSVRYAAALLAGKMKKQSAVKQLIGDKDPQVQSGAVLVAAVTGMTEMCGEVLAIFEKTISAGKYDSDRRDLAASCAYMLASLQPTPDISRKICDAILKCQDEKLAERLLTVLPIIADDNTRQTALQLLAQAKDAGKLPAPMVLIICGRMNITQAGRYAVEVLRMANVKTDILDGMTQSHVIAAVNALRALSTPCRREIYEFVKKYWRPDCPLMLIPAARLLGEQMAVNQGDAKNVPTHDECLELLYHAASYSNDDGKGNVTTTPLASAAAATAAWMAKPSHIEFIISEGTDPTDETMQVQFTTAFLARQAAANEQAQSGDYVAWNIGRTQSVDAYALGQWFLPTDDEHRREFNPDVRSTGAILLAVAAASADQRVDAESRIDPRIKREGFFSRGSCLCALLMLWPGRETLHEQVHEYMYMDVFPRRRVFTALTFAGDKQAMDYLLLNANKSMDELALELVVWGMDEVLSVTAPSLIAPDPAAFDEVRTWQTKIMQTQWACNRNSMQYGVLP